MNIVVMSLLMFVGITAYILQFILSSPDISYHKAFMINKESGPVEEGMILRGDQFFNLFVALKLKDSIPTYN